MSERLQTLSERARAGAPEGYFLQGIYNANDPDECQMLASLRQNTQKYQVVDLGVGNIAVYEVNEMAWLAEFMGTKFLR